MISISYYVRSCVSPTTCVRNTNHEFGVFRLRADDVEEFKFRVLWKSKSLLLHSNVHSGSKYHTDMEGADKEVQPRTAVSSSIVLRFFMNGVRNSGQYRKGCRLTREQFFLQYFSLPQELYAISAEIVILNRCKNPMKFHYKNTEILLRFCDELILYAASFFVYTRDKKIVHHCAVHRSSNQEVSDSKCIQDCSHGGKISLVSTNFIYR